VASVTLLMALCDSLGETQISMFPGHSPLKSANVYDVPRHERHAAIAPDRESEGRSAAVRVIRSGGAQQVLARWPAWCLRVLRGGNRAPGTSADKRTLP
jgi:hypothetical protein